MDEEQLQKLARAVVEADAARTLMAATWQEVGHSDKPWAKKRHTYELYTGATEKYNTALEAVYDAVGWDTQRAEGLINIARVQYEAEAEAANNAMLDWDEHPVEGQAAGG